MDFNLSEEQQMLVDSIEKFVANEYDFDTRRQLTDSELGFSSANWEKFADFGWLSVPFAEQHGGFSGSVVDVMLMAEAFGKVLVTEPFVPSIVLGGRLIELLGNASQCAELLPPLIEGKLQLALAYNEAGTGGNPACVTTRATRDGDDYVISGGEKLMVLNGHAADYLLVTARSDGNDRDARGIEILVVDSKSEGLTQRAYPTVDGLRAADIKFSEVRVPAGQCLGDPNANLHVLETVIDEAIVAFGAEAIGAMETLVKTTVEYAQTREQFGSPIGKFQALQHRMVDMFIAHEESKSLLYMAALRSLEGGNIAKRAASALKVQLSKAGRLVGQEAVQIHGGMGMTDELKVGHYFKRLTAIDTLFGSYDYHLERYARLN